MIPRRLTRGRPQGRFAACVAPGLAALLGGCGAPPDAPLGGPPARVIELPIPAPEDSAGGILVADVDGDDRPDYLVTSPGHLAVIGNDGRPLWTLQAPLVVDGSSESEGLPGHHGPGVAVGDVDGDGHAEVIFPTREGEIRVLDAATGAPEASATPPVPARAERWELVLVADFRGTGGDRDVLLQATNAAGYRMGRYLAAYAFEDLVRGGAPLWTTDVFEAAAHNGARIADLDGDGRDEVLGQSVLGPDGAVRVRAAKFKGHIDSVFVEDVRPDVPGLEVVLLEEGDDHVQVLGLDGVLWRRHYQEQEPQNAAVGRFQPGSDGVHIWCRSRYRKHQKPFVFDANGEVVADYALDDVAPAGWTPSGVEVIHRIDWTGGPTQLACAKERHRDGSVVVFQPLSGLFVAVFPEKARRLYVADVLGDWREEVIVLADDALHVYQNDAPNPRPERARLWTDRNYRRLKQAHNYYSP